MTMLKRHWIAAMILCLFMALGIVYSVATPVLEASDELNHYPFVAYLAGGNGLPVQRPGEETLWGQEGSQPPLYYALAAALTSWIDVDDLTELVVLNPHAMRGVPLSPDNKNMVVHSSREAFPWRGSVLAVHLIRLLSLLLASGTVLCTYLLARALVPGQPAVALSAMAFNAFLPMFLFISASVNNDTLVVLLSSIALVMMVRIVQRDASRGFMLALGVVVGLACLTKLGALGLIPLAGLALALRFVSSQWPPALQLAGGPAGRLNGRVLSPGAMVRRWIVDFLFVLVPVILVAGWWYWRNWQLYGDPTGLAMMLEIAGRRPAAPSLTTLLGEFQGFRINFWGLFGAVNVLMRPAWIYTLLDLVTLAAAVGFVAWVWRTWRPQRYAQWPALMLAGAWIAIEFIALLRWTSVTLASQGRLIFPALSSIALFFALGWVGWLSIRWQRTAAALVAGLMFVVAALAPFVAIQPAYRLPRDLLAAGVPATARPINTDYDGVVRLLAVETDKESVQPGDTLNVTLYWQALAPLQKDYSVFVQVTGWQQNLGQRDTYPVGGGYPTSRWVPGQIVRDRHQITIRPDAKSPGPAWIAAGLYEFDTMERLEAVDAAGQPVSFPNVAKLGLERGGVTWQPQHKLDVNLENRVRLIGFDTPDEQPKPGQEWPLTLYWQVEGDLNRDYTVFVHVLDETGTLLTQGDGPPLDGRYPTSDWMPGEILNDTHSLTIPAGAAPGRYQVFVGLYEPSTEQRLLVLDGTGQAVDSRVLLTEFELNPGGG